MRQIKIEHLTEDQKRNHHIPDVPKVQGKWSVWECAPSVFDWFYNETEKAYVYEGRVKIRTDEEEVEIKAGDYVVFPKNLSCTWEIIDRIRKVYTFEEE